MNEKDLRAMFSEIIALHMTNFDTKLEVIKTNIEYINEKTSDVIQLVNEHSEDISKLQKNDVEHFVNCPMDSRVKKLEISEAIKTETI